MLAMSLMRSAYAAPLQRTEDRRQKTDRQIAFPRLKVPRLGDHNKKIRFIYPPLTRTFCPLSSVLCPQNGSTDRNTLPRTSTMEDLSRMPLLPLYSRCASATCVDCTEVAAANLQ